MLFLIYNRLKSIEYHLYRRYVIFYCKINAKLYNIVSNELDVIHALSLVYSIGNNALMRWGVDESMGGWIKTIVPKFCIVGAGD